MQELTRRQSCVGCNVMVLEEIFNNEGDNKRHWFLIKLLIILKSPCIVVIKNNIKKYT